MDIPASRSPASSPLSSLSGATITVTGGSIAGIHFRRSGNNDANSKAKKADSTVATTAATSASASSSSSSSSTDDAVTKIPTVTVPPTKDAPFRRSSSLPEGFVFIVVGAAIGFAFLCVIAWRALVALSVSRSVRKVVAVGADDNTDEKGPGAGTPLMQSHSKGNGGEVGETGYSTSRADSAASSPFAAAGTERGRRYDRERTREAKSGATGITTRGIRAVSSRSPSSAPSPIRGFYSGNEKSSPEKARPYRDPIFSRGYTADQNSSGYHW